MFSMVLSQLVVTYALPARKTWHMISKTCRMPSICIVTVDYIFVLGKGRALQWITELQYSFWLQNNGPSWTDSCYPTRPRLNAKRQVRA